MNESAERRLYKRVGFTDQVKIHRVTESKSGNVFEVQGDAVPGKGFNISEGGLRVELSEKVRPNSIVKLNFQVEREEGSEVDVYAKVVWVQKAAYGIQFIVLDEKTRKTIRIYVENREEVE